MNYTDLIFDLYGTLVDIHTEEDDLDTDIAGAKNAGLATLYMHTNPTPPDQRCADPDNSHEYEGWDWEELVKVIESL